jgi:hypothetical protein
VAAEAALDAAARLPEEVAAALDVAAEQPPVAAAVPGVAVGQRPAAGEQASDEEAAPRRAAGE